MSPTRNPVSPTTNDADRLRAILAECEWRITAGDKRASVRVKAERIARRLAEIEAAGIEDYNPYGEDDSRHEAWEDFRIA